MVLAAFSGNSSIRPDNNDSTEMKSKELNEIVVTAKNQYTTKDKTVYIPTKRDKKASGSGTALLQQMAIPQIYVSPSDNTISTSAGEGVATFIDYLPATENDLANIRTMDVLRVEVLDFPKDPRFGGAKHVVNFIMVKYEYGGYTKVNGLQRFINDAGSYGAASKMTYKKMTYDINGGFTYINSDHNGENSIAEYLFPDQQIDRTVSTIESGSKQRTAFAALRAVYQANKAVISNTVGLSGSKRPDGYQLNETAFSPAVYGKEAASTRTDRTSLTPVWRGNYQWYLPKNMSLVVEPSASYGKYTQDYAYTSGSEQVINSVDEKAWSFDASATVHKSINRNSISLSLGGGGQGNDIEYSGTTPATVDTRYYYGGGRLSVNIQSDKAWMQGGAGLYYNRTSINKESKNEVHPKYFISGGYVFNDKNKLTASSEMSYWTVPLSQQGTNMQMQNLIDAIQGNPDLKAYRFNAVNVFYEWLPSNKLSASLFCRVYRLSSPVTYVYQPLESSPTPVMVRNTVNSGFLNSCSYGGTASLRLLNNTLSLRVGLSGESVSRHGRQAYSDNTVKANAQVSYTLNNFYAQAAYESKKTAIDENTISDIPQFYSVSIGWGSENLNVSLRATNLFNSDWKGRERRLLADNYRYCSQSLSGDYHRAFSISVSYSFSYGKKVRRTQSPSVGATVGSAILE